MSVFQISPKYAANALRFLASRDTGDELQFRCAEIAAQHGLCSFYSFGDASYDHVILNPRFPVHLASEDAIGLGKALLANMRAYNSAAVQRAHPATHGAEETADAYARHVLLAALRQGTKVNTADAVEAVQLIPYNTIDNGGEDHAKGVDGLPEFLASMTSRAFGILADMWRRGEKEAR
jgi:hypothetical protein